MKKIAFIILCAITLLPISARAFTLDDITSGKFRPQDVPESYPSTDGIHYYTATNGNTRIVKCEYRTGHEVDTLFDVKTAQKKIKSDIISFIEIEDNIRLY